MKLTETIPLVVTEQQHAALRQMQNAVRVYAGKDYGSSAASRQPREPLASHGIAPTRDHKATRTDYPAWNVAFDNTRARPAWAIRIPVRQGELHIAEDILGIYKASKDCLELPKAMGGRFTFRDGLQLSRWPAKLLGVMLYEDKDEDVSQTRWYVSVCYRG